MKNQSLLSLMIICTASSLQSTPPVDELIDAIKVEDMETVKRLLKEGVDPYKCGNKGHTPLYVSMKHPSKFATLLLQNGVYEEVQWDKALGNAIRKGTMEHVKLLVEYRQYRPSKAASYTESPCHYVKPERQTLPSHYSSNDYSRPWFSNP